jgi:hypothetical protein
MTFDELWKELEKEDPIYIKARKQAEVLVKHIQDNCRYCNSSYEYEDIIDDCKECPLLQKVLKENIYE